MMMKTRRQLPHLYYPKSDTVRIINAHQTAGGGGGAWSPLDLTPAAWYRGDDVTESSLAVSSWNDKSGNGRHITQSTSTKKPTYSATGGPNSTPVLTFDAGDVLEITSGSWGSALPIASGYTMIGVFKYDHASVTVSYAVYDGASRYAAVNSGGFAMNDGILNRVYATHNTNWNYHENNMEDYTGAKNCNHRLNGGSPYSATNYNYSLRALAVGGLTGASAAFLGKWAELIIVPGALTSGQRADLATYLSDRYSL